MRLEASDYTAGNALRYYDSVTRYMYGRTDMSVEQINNSTGVVEYLHHDQQGSTRLLTGSTGTVTGKCSYSAYGTPTCEGTATTPLGWDGQYTSSDTGLVYLRNRVYDPSTAQFLSVDPAVALTREPYAYGGDNPVNRRDPTGSQPKDWKASRATSPSAAHRRQPSKESSTASKESHMASKACGNWSTKTKDQTTKAKPR